MALKLFDRVKYSKGLFAVEKITLIYVFLTSILIMFLFERMDHPVQMLLDRAIIVLSSLALAYLYKFYPCKLSAFIRMGFQMSLLSYWYPDTFEFNRFLPNLDYLFASIEQLFFNCQPAIIFCRAFPNDLISELFNMCYFLYYPLILIVMLYYFIRRFDLFEKVSFVLVTSFFIYYLIYIFIPVAGPQYYFPAIGLDQVIQGVFPPIGDYFNTNQELLPNPVGQDGFFYGLVEHSQQVGERPTAAFPSSHVGISTILMILAWRVNKKMFTLLLPIYIFLCGATVYIQAHYAIDVIAGLISAIIIYILASKIFNIWFSKSLFD